MLALIAMTFHRYRGVHHLMALQLLLSISSSSLIRLAVIPIASAAVDAFSAVFQRIEAQPSGEITEYVEY